MGKESWEQLIFISSLFSSPQRSASTSNYLFTSPSFLFISLLPKKRTKESILRERFSSTSPLILLRVASKLAALKQSRQSHYADFAGFPSRKSFQVGRRYHDALAYAMYFFFIQNDLHGFGFIRKSEAKYAMRRSECIVSIV